MPRPLGHLDTVTDQLPRVYKFRVEKKKKQQEHYTQIVAYSVGLPSRIGEAWLNLFGDKVTFQITEEGLLIRPEPLIDDVKELLAKELFKETDKK